MKIVEFNPGEIPYSFKECTCKLIHRHAVVRAEWLHIYSSAVILFLDLVRSLQLHKMALIHSLIRVGDNRDIRVGN